MAPVVAMLVSAAINRLIQKKKEEGSNTGALEVGGQVLGSYMGQNTGSSVGVTDKPSISQGLRSSKFQLREPKLKY